MNDMNNEKSGFPFIRLALVGIAGYALWRNRARISSLISSTGIKEKVLAALPAELDAGKMIDSGRSLVKEAGSEISKHVDSFKSNDKASDISKRLAV